MASKNRTIRFKLYSLLSLPIVALIALWTFVTGHLVGDAFDMLRADAMHTYVANPIADLSIRLRHERVLSAVLVSSQQWSDTQLDSARRETDQALQAFKAKSSDMSARSATPQSVAGHLDALYRELGDLTGIRAAVDARKTNRLETVQAYDRLQDSILGIKDELTLLPDVELHVQYAQLQKISQAREIMSREEALLAGAVLQARTTPEEHDAFAALVAQRRLLWDQGLLVLDKELRAPYDELEKSATYKKVTFLEDQVVSRSRDVSYLDQTTANWRIFADDLGQSMDKLDVAQGNLLNERTAPQARGVITEIGVAGGAGLLAILVAVILSARLGRGLAMELATLRSTALELANDRLPNVVRKLGKGEVVDVNAEAPPIAATGTTLEVRDLSDSFSSVQRTAIEAAVRQAQMRQGVSTVFRNLARRNQSLLHRQLAQLDGMQRKATEPEVLEDLFRLDHLTTRMRRQAEGLIILSGAAAGRAWRKPVPFLDVVRGAVAEVEDYTRVTVLPMPNAALTGSAVADIIHLLAELVENATTFSPPNTKVTVRGGVVGRGYAVEVEDRGLGLSEADRADINARLEDPPEFDLADSDRLGLFVVGQLAVRHNIKVSVHRSPYGGTTAVVLIPRSLIVESVSTQAAGAVPAQAIPALEKRD